MGLANGRVFRAGSPGTGLTEALSSDLPGGFLRQPLSFSARKAKNRVVIPRTIGDLRWDESCIVEI